MTDYKRVREGRWEYSIPTHRVTDGVEVLDKSAYAPSGKPAPPKPVTDLGTPAPGSKQERRRRATKKAAAKKAAAPKTTGANDSGEDAGQTSAAPETEN